MAKELPQINKKTALALAWLASFVLLAVFLAVNIWRMGFSVQKIASLYSEIGAKERESAEISREMDASDEELSYLGKLSEPNPNEKSVARTQSVINAEVRELRKKIEQRVGNKLYIAVDSKSNKLFLKKGTKLLWEADCSVGKGGVVKDKKSGRVWEFVTPRGEFTVRYKMEDPLWIKPDWAFVESKEPVPPREDPSRLVKGELGAFALDIGNGYLIHGTKNEATLGMAVSHGCVRLGAEPLEKLYKAAPVGTKVYIY